MTEEKEDKEKREFLIELVNVKDKQTAAYSIDVPSFPEAASYAYVHRYMLTQRPDEQWKIISIVDKKFYEENNREL